MIEFQFYDEFGYASEADLFSAEGVRADEAMQCDWLKDQPGLIKANGHRGGRRRHRATDRQATVLGHRPDPTDRG
jgi:hypothetical protein